MGYCREGEEKMSRHEEDLTLGNRVITGKRAVRNICKQIGWYRAEYDIENKKAFKKGKRKGIINKNIKYHPSRLYSEKAKALMWKESALKETLHSLTGFGFISDTEELINYFN